MRHQAERNKTVSRQKIKYRLEYPSINVDAFTNTYSTQGVTLTFDLQNITRSSGGSTGYSR